jgi:formylglycine-generating enzyme required for sulfatase activity
MCETEVTIGQYLAFCDETKANYPSWLDKDGKKPIIYNDAWAGTGN